MSGRWPLCVDAGLPATVQLYSLVRPPQRHLYASMGCVGWFPILDMLR